MSDEKEKKDNQSEWDDDFRQKRGSYLMTSPVIIDTIPGDKSISHRAIIIGALANGVTHFNGFLCSDDCLNTLKIFQSWGRDYSRWDISNGSRSWSRRIQSHHQQP